MNLNIVRIKDTETDLYRERIQKEEVEKLFKNKQLKQ